MEASMYLSLYRWQYLTCDSILHDGRLLWQVLQGKAAFVGILDPDGAQGWKARMPLPRSEESENIIQQIRKKSKSFCNHFTWV